MARTTATPDVADAPETSDPAEDSTVFVSDYPALIVFDEGRIVATFDKGRFATSDVSVIAALKRVPSVRVEA